MPWSRTIGGDFCIGAKNSPLFAPIVNSSPTSFANVCPSCGRQASGDFLLAIEAVDWLVQHRAWIYSYLDAPKTLGDLQQAAAQGPRPGYNIHHIVEQTPAAQDDFPRSMIDAPDNLVLIPTLKHWEITAWFQTANPDFGDVSPREYLRGKDWDERLRIGRYALIHFGVLQP